MCNGQQLPTKSILFNMGWLCLWIDTLPTKVCLALLDVSLCSWDMAENEFELRSNTLLALLLHVFRCFGLFSPGVQAALNFLGLLRSEVRR